MREILNELLQWQREGEEIALATLVQSFGPVPRPSGARFAMTRSGRTIGSVSGGCIEGDVFERSLQVLESGLPAIQRYGIDDAEAIAVGLSCGGEVDLLIDKLAWDEKWQKLSEALLQQHRVFLCVGLDPPTLTGRMYIVDPDGTDAGSIHPELDATISDHARNHLMKAGPEILDVQCEGQPARIFIEPLQPQPRLFIVGATHIATILAPMASLVGHHVSVIDPRTAFATRERFPDVDALITEWPDSALKSAQIDAHCCIVSLSHDMKFDLPTLAHALRSDARYVGALGSTRTHRKRLEQLRSQGFGEAELTRIHTPIGLDLGGRSPEEIALAIVAEIVATRYDKASLALSTSPPAHGPEVPSL